LTLVKKIRILEGGAGGIRGKFAVPNLA